MTIRHEVDVTKPFVAIRSERDGRGCGACEAEYLVNPLGEPLRNVATSTGGAGICGAGICGVGGGAGPRQSALIVAPRGFVRIGRSTRSAYDAFLVYWSISYETESGGAVGVGFGSYKGLADARWMAEIPILGGAGWILPRSVTGS
ncbi:MAG TPA: hypothetical protein VNJ51_09340 [Candidatus Dormibacteraeota bacterium]|nr:hypothetical protein [Candidatus Dormibacteraeota bacterium]